MRSLMFVGGGILIGAGLVWGDSRVWIEKKRRELEQEAELTVLRTLEAIGKSSLGDAETPAETEEELTFNEAGSILEQEVETVPPGYIQEYVQQANSYSDGAHMTQPEPMEIIDDEMYAEEDGRAKEQIQVFMGDGEPYFVQDGMVIDDHVEKIGDNILVMFYQNFGPDAKERIIYIRNHSRGEDFEVIQEMGP